MQDQVKIASKRHPEIILRVIPGHFATPNSHITHFIDMTPIKARQSEARNVAAAMSEAYFASTVVDTILCMEGTEVIGAYLADELTKVGVLSKNAHRTMYVATPEYDVAGQMIFRDNLQMMIRGKNVLILLASATTGTTVARAVESVRYYGGTVSGISAIFSAASKICGYPVNALFTTADLPAYKTYKSDDCRMCREGKRIDAIANGFGFSKL